MSIVAAVEITSAPPWVAKAKTQPCLHQIDGVKALVKHSYFLLADEVGAGKSKQVIDAAQILRQAGIIDTVLVLVPNFARGVWADPELGEIAKHGWDGVDNQVAEYSVRHPKVPTAIPEGLSGEVGRQSLRWIVTNYEFSRRSERLTPLLKSLRDRHVLLVCDEAWALKDHRTDQWKAAHKLRQLSDRIVELNGTPVADNPLDLFAQMKLLDPGIIGIKYFTNFRARYAMLAPNVNFPKITGWQNLEELRAKVEPFTLRRRTRDCFDLPSALEPVIIEAALSDEEWRIYKEMRDDMITWLDAQTESVAQQAIVRSMRLRQITSGILGGLADLTEDLGGKSTRSIGTSKQDALLRWFEVSGLEVDRGLIWAVFRLEIERAADALRASGLYEVHMLYGGQSEEDRQAAQRALTPGPKPTRPVRVVGNPQAGGAALNLAGASVAATLSHHPSLRVYLQARGRIDRPGQVNHIQYVDVVATGPKGQRTIDHHTVAALRKKEDIAAWTTATWRRKLLEE